MGGLSLGRRIEGHLEMSLFGFCYSFQTLGKEQVFFLKQENNAIKSSAPAQALEATAAQAGWCTDGTGQTAVVSEGTARAGRHPWELPGPSCTWPPFSCPTPSPERERGGWWDGITLQDCHASVHMLGVSYENIRISVHDEGLGSERPSDLPKVTQQRANIKLCCFQIQFSCSSHMACWLLLWRSKRGGLTGPHPAGWLPLGPLGRPRADLGHQKEQTRLSLRAEKCQGAWRSPGKKQQALVQRGGFTCHWHARLGCGPWYMGAGVAWRMRLSAIQPGKDLGGR